MDGDTEEITVKSGGFAESDDKTMIESDGFDYTKWRREFFGKMKPGEFSEEAVADAKAHPYKGKGKRL